MRPSRQGTIDFSSLGDSPRFKRKDSLLSDRDSFSVRTPILSTKQVTALHFIGEIYESEIQDQLNNYRILLNHEEQIQNENAKVEKHEFVLLLQDIRNINNAKREKLASLTNQPKVTFCLSYLSISLLTIIIYHSQPPQKKLNPVQLCFIKVNAPAQISTQQSVVSHQIDTDAIDNKLKDELDLNTFLKQKASYLRFRISKYQHIISNLKSTILLVDRTLAGFALSDQTHSVKLASSYLQQLTANLQEEELSRQEILKKKRELMERARQGVFYALKLEEEAFQKRVGLEKKLELQIAEIEEHGTAIREKFNLIQRCAEFLDQLDDFDKLALIFIYDQPKNFNLDEIYHILAMQINRPKEQYQKQSLEEFLERLRFNQVSIRMNLFIRFHKNNLKGLVSELVKVFKELQSQETLLNYRYMDLLNQLHASHKSLRQFERLIIQQQQHLTSPHEFRVLEENQADQELQQEIRIIEQSFKKFDQFLLGSYFFVVFALGRFINTFQAISEILKSCRNDDFELSQMNPPLYQCGSFYVNAVYNKLFEIIKKEEMTRVLDRQFQIKIVNSRASMRHSNLILNTFFDQIENKIIHQMDRKNIRRRQKYYNLHREGEVHRFHKISLLVSKYFPSLENYERRVLTESLRFDGVLSQFTKLSEIDQILIDLSAEHSASSFTLLLDELQIAVRNLKMESFFKKIAILFGHIKQLFQSTSIEPNFNFIEHLYQKYNLQEQIEKIKAQFQTNFKYEVKDQTKTTIQSKIQQIEAYKGRNNTDLGDQNELANDKNDSHLFSEEVLRLRKQQVEKVDLNLMHDTLQSIKKDLLQISLQQKPANRASKPVISIANTPIFNHLNAKHRKNKKNTERMKININTIASTLKIEGIDSPGKNSYRSNLGTRRNVTNYSKNQSPLQQGSSDLPSIEQKQRKSKICEKINQNRQKILIQDDFKSQYFLKFSKSMLQQKESTQQSGVVVDSITHGNSSSYYTKQQDLLSKARSQDFLPKSYMFPLYLEKRKSIGFKLGDLKQRSSILNEYFGKNHFQTLQQ